jgi:TatD DNase family protein
MHDLLRHAVRPACGFLLHSYGGSRDLVRPLAALGAFFGFPGYFLHARKARQRAAFQVVPWDRLLVETDAPDQVLPTVAEWRMTDCEGAGVGSGPAVGGWRPVALRTDGVTVLNHPGNVEWVYRGLAEVRGVGVEELIGQVAVGFARLFGAQAWG